MLVEEGGDVQMKVLVECDNTNLAVRTICNSIIDVLDSETTPFAMQVDNVSKTYNHGSSIFYINFLLG
jgi:hypothetical protein